MKYYYSPSAQAFYVEEMFSAYETAGTLPSDLMPVSEDEYWKLYEAVNSGHKVELEEGVLSLVKVEMEDTNKEAEVFWRDAELRYADIELNKVQDSDPGAFGTVGQWRQYRRELRAWPEHPKFPCKAFRPKPPKE